MLKSIEINKFKGFESFAMDDMKPITMIGGQNNTGKTALLESIFLTLGYSSPNIFLALYFARNLNIGKELPKFTPDRLWNPLFYNLTANNVCSIKLTFANQKFSKLSLEKVRDENAGLNINADTIAGLFKRGTSNKQFDSKLFALNFTSESVSNTIRGTFSIENGQIKHISQGKIPDVGDMVKVVYYRNVMTLDTQTLAEIVSNIIADNHKDTLIKVLQYFEANVSDVYVTLEDGIAGVNVRLNTGIVLPLSYMGDGINKGLQLFSLVLTTENGIVLIDEIENGLHYTSYLPLLKILYKTALQQNSQLIITTHSEEVIGQSVHIMESFGWLDKMSYQRLDRAKKVTVTAYTGQELLDSIEYNMEVR